MPELPVSFPRTGANTPEKVKVPISDAKRRADAKWRREKRSPYTSAGYDAVAQQGSVVFQFDGGIHTASPLGNKQRGGYQGWTMYSGTLMVEFTRNTSTAKAFPEFALVEMARKVIWKETD